MKNPFQFLDAVKSGPKKNSLQFQGLPCSIGYIYLRIMVDGSILPCCVAKHAVGTKSESKDWRDVWFSSSFDSFREKTKTLHVEKFNLVDPDWSFCNQCPHEQQNSEWYENSKKTGY
jgi:hypothetical protein